MMRRVITRCQRGSLRVAWGVLHDGKATTRVHDQKRSLHDIHGSFRALSGRSPPWIMRWRQGGLHDRVSDDIALMVYKDRVLQG
jgi:hypothetical protein